MSKPEKIDIRQDDLFRRRLCNQLNPNHPLFMLTGMIDWEGLETYFAPLYQAELGHPPRPIRLIIGLMMLQHVEGLSDEQVVLKWVENPYYQYFCGYDHFQWKLPINPSSLTRWRGRIGKEGLEKILAATIQVGKDCGKISEKSCRHVITDTTVMEKAITFPTDSKLLNRARQKLVGLVKKQGLCLRQSYHRVGKKAYTQACRYGHAGQYKRMKGQVKKLKTYLGRVIRDIERKLPQGAPTALWDMLNQAKRLMTQEKDTPNKLYSLHAPEVECIAKGKAHKKYEFGCKVSFVVTHKEGFVLSSQALHGNPYDGHTLQVALDHAKLLSGIPIQRAFIDKGYRKHGVEGAQVFMSGQKRLSQALRRALIRRNAIEPHIGHMKSEGKLARNHLKGAIGDVFNALLVAIGHNLRLILNHLRDVFAFIREWIKTILHSLILKNSFS
jgi:IS5 family transposase